MKNIYKKYIIKINKKITHHQYEKKIENHKKTTHENRGLK